MRRLGWALVFALASMLAMLVDALRDYAKDRVIPKDDDEKKPEGDR